MNIASCWDCKIIIYLFIYSAKLWAERVGKPCPMEEAGSLKSKFLRLDNFLVTDFVKPGGIRLNRSAVPLGLESASLSNPQHSPPLLPTVSNPQPSAVTPKDSNLPVLIPLPLTSELSPEENNLQVLQHQRTCSRLPSSSTHVETPLPNHIQRMDKKLWQLHCSSEITLLPEVNKLTFLQYNFPLVYHLQPNLWKASYTISESTSVDVQQ